ncbi:hypothetical protein [Mycobacteroides chelonae]|uniref:hypothetical protein n=1 Tax=Mycobacteroides chelonae TaxID=1774 RepID=UPI000B1D4364|nr:hypothetical protein [Mycobacteroides chelonae]AYM42226.1 hypothetical protein DYE20_12260 [[Mycobacterium] chelonae subsp. gwanakae]
MNMLARRLTIVAAGTLLPLAAVSGIVPISSADPIVPNCPDGWWDPVGNVCRPPVVPPQ